MNHMNNTETNQMTNQELDGLTIQEINALTRALMRETIELTRETIKKLENK